MPAYDANNGDSEPSMQWAHAVLTRSAAASTPSVFDDEHDRVWVLPDPFNVWATWVNPCPGLTLRNTTDAFGRYSGFNVTGFMTPSVYSRCLRRTFYTSSATSAAETDLGPRSIEIRAYGPVRAAFGSQFSAVSQLLEVAEGCPGGCDASGLKTAITWFDAPCPSSNHTSTSPRSLVVAPGT